MKPITDARRAEIRMRNAIHEARQSEYTSGSVVLPRSAAEQIADTLAGADTEARSSRRWFWLVMACAIYFAISSFGYRTARNAVAPVTIEGCGRPLSPGLYEYVPIPPRTADRVVWPTPIYRRKVWNV